MNSALITLEQIKDNFTDHARNLINVQKMGFDKYKLELEKAILAIDAKEVLLKDAQEMKTAMIDIFTELKSLDKYNELKAVDEKTPNA